MVDEFQYPEDINDFLMQNVIVDKRGVFSSATYCSRSFRTLLL